jgi:hypothetical protein
MPWSIRHQASKRLGCRQRIRWADSTLAAAMCIRGTSRRRMPSTRIVPRQPATLGQPPGSSR